MWLLKKMPRWKSDHSDDFELHVLTQKSGLSMLAWGLRSFLFHSGLCPRMIIHSDGTIDEATARMFESKFDNLKVLLRKDADRIIDNRSDIPEKIKKYRYGSNILILELTDIFLLATSKNVMLLDNDILFFQYPKEIVDFVQGKSSYDALSTYTEGLQKGQLESIDPAFIKKYDLENKKAAHLISGIIVYQREKLKLEKFIEYFDHTLDPENHFVEQAGWASLITQLNFKFLEEARYPVKGMPKESVCKHFTTPRRFELYAYGIDEVRKRISP